MESKALADPKSRATVKETSARAAASRLPVLLIDKDLGLIELAERVVLVEVRHDHAEREADE
jgi:hypothetical protein